MREFGKMRIEGDGDRRIIVTRRFEAPREEVFEAYTKPEHVQHWLGVFGGWEMSECEVDLRIGGEFHYVWTGPDGKRMGYRGRYTELDPPERISIEATFDEPWFEGEERGTVVFEEVGTGTVITTWLRYATKEVRDGVLASPMAQGMALSFDMLEEYLGLPEERWMDAEAAVSSGAWHG